MEITAEYYFYQNPKKFTSMEEEGRWSESVVIEGKLYISNVLLSASSVFHEYMMPGNTRIPLLVKIDDIFPVCIMLLEWGLMNRVFITTVSINEFTYLRLDKLSMDQYPQLLTLGGEVSDTFS